MSGLRWPTLLTAAALVVSCDLTGVEVDRALIRAVELHELSEGDAISRSERFAEASLRWMITRIDDDVISRARERFPNEPVRALDALHLASTVIAQLSVPNLAVLSLDDVVRDNARALGFEVLPA